MTKRLFCAAALCMAGMLAVSAQSVRFNNEGKLKIVQFTDIHWRAGDPATADAAANMNRVLDEEKPDLVIYTGDITTAKPAAEGLDRAFEPAISRGIPYAATLGNHDDEQDLTRQQLFDYIRKKQGSFNSQAEGNDFAISVTSADGKQTKAVLYVMDSNAYSTIDSLKGYGWFRRDQIDWYARKSAELASTALGNPLVGQRGEKACSPAINSGMFAAMLEAGDVMGTFVGHDHVNNYVTPWHGILLGYGQFTGGKTTYTDGRRGARVIELTEGKRGFRTWIRMSDGTVKHEVCWPEDFKN